MTAEADVTVVDWDSFDLEEFTRELRGNLSGPDADKLIWAFEHAVEVARTDDDLLSYLVRRDLLLARPARRVVTAHRARGVLPSLRFG